MDTIITFGQHKGKTVEYLLKNEIRYCKWVIDNLKNSGIRDILKEEYDKITIIKGAWYSYKEAEILLKNELTPSLNSYSDRYEIFESCENLNVMEYINYIGLNALSDEEAFEKMFSLALFCSDNKIFKREIVKIALLLKPIEDENKKMDMNEELPNKKILS